MDGTGRDTVIPVVLLLDTAAARRFVDRLPHGVGDLVAVEDRFPVYMAGGTADGLGERAVRAEKSFLVRIENGHQRYFRQVEPLAQQVDPDQHVETSLAQVLHDLYPLQRIDIGMDVAATDTHMVEVFIQLLGHPFGQRRHQYPLLPRLPQADLFHQIVGIHHCSFP